MKKIILTVLVISIISCNKSETKKEDKIKSDSIYISDSIANKSILDSIINIAALTPKQEFAIEKDSSGYYHLKYILEKGKTYPFNLREKSKQTMSVGNQSQSMDEDSFDNISITVTDVKEDKYLLKINYISKKITSKIDGQTIVIDTKGKEPVTEDPNLKRMWRVNKALYDTSFTMEMDQYGRVSNIKGMDAIYARVKKELSKDLKDKELDDFINIIKQNFNSDVFKQQFEATTIQFPEKGVKIGEKWSNDKGNKGEAYNTLKKVDSSFAEINLQGKIPSKSDSKTEEGITFKISVSGTQSGKILLDVKSGWVHKANLDLIVTQKESATKDNKTQTRTMKSENHSYINHN